MNMNINRILNYFPHALSEKLKNEIKFYKNIQEIRVRSEKKICIMSDSRNIVLNSKAANDDIEYIFNNICEHSVYKYQDEINSGFITIKGGNRVGVCGTAVFEKGRIITVKNISSLNFRIAKDYYGCSEKVMQAQCNNIIIAGPPGSGKTTILRDIARNLSKNNHKVCIVDERFEISGTDNEFELGDMTDCLRGYEKPLGISLAVRTLSPDYIIFDEIGSFEECCGVFESFNAGVHIITSVHCDSKKQFLRRPVCKKLMESNFFEEVVFLKNIPGEIDEIYFTGNEKICV